MAKRCGLETSDKVRLTTAIASDIRCLPMNVALLNTRTFSPLKGDGISQFVEINRVRLAAAFAMGQ